MITSPEQCKEFFEKLKKRIIELEKIVKGKIVFFDGELTPNSVFYFRKVVRKLSGEKLFLILESPGGQIDSAAKMVHMCKEYFKEFNIIVPSYAKSAATLVCVSSDNLFLGKAGEMGPIDPQVKHPIDPKIYIPALSIKDAIEFIESSKDPYVKIGLTEKIDPYLMGAYKRVINIAEQYLEDSNLIKNSKNSLKIIESLTQKYISHGYPIDISECKKLGIEIKYFKNKKVMDEIYSFFEDYIDNMSTPNITPQLIIMSSNLCINNINLKINKPINENKIKKILDSQGKTDEDSIREKITKLKP